MKQVAATPYAFPVEGNFEPKRAALLVIDVTTRTAETVLLSAVDRGAGGQIIERYRVLDVADLNGDGRMEVLVHAWYYEGAGVLVYTYDGSTLTEVLATGCGS